MHGPIPTEAVFILRPQHSTSHYFLLCSQPVSGPLGAPEGPCGGCILDWFNQPELTQNICLNKTRGGVVTRKGDGGRGGENE